MQKKVLVCGGDKRHYIAAKLIREKGYDVTVCGFENLPAGKEINNASFDTLPNADYIMLPAPYRDADGALKMPFSDRRLTLLELCAKVPGAKVVYGGADAESAHAFQTYGIGHSDIFNDETYTVRNAYITAQAAVMLCAAKSQRALSDCSILICGYGRIGRSLLKLLQGYNADVWVTARKSKDLEWISVEGGKAVSTGMIGKIIGGRDIVFNTIPHPVIEKKELRCSDKNTIFFELASRPHGIDFEEANRLGLTVYLELGLPGRCFPYSAAIAVAEAFERTVQEKDGGK